MFTAALAVFGSVACGHDECDEPLKLCDIGSADCREHVFVQTACARDFDGRDVPEVRTITRDEFADSLRDDDEPTEEELREDAQQAASLRMLALLQPGETSSEEAAIQSYASHVIAFYSRDDQDVTIISTNLGDADRESQDYVLSHEFVHAQQDVDIGLQDFFDEHVTSSDSNTAVRSITEGEAVLFSNVTLARQKGRAFTSASAQSYFAEQQDGLWEMAETSSKADYADLSSSFPYPFGGQLVADRWFDDEMSGVRALYADPPVATAQILRAIEHDQLGDVDIPTLAADVLPEGWSIVTEDTFGAWITYAIATRAGIDHSDARALAKDWLGDHLLVAGGPTDADVALAWRVRFGSEDSAVSFTDIDEYPPLEGVRSVALDGRNVTVLMASDEDALATWSDAIERAVVEPGPHLRSGSLARGLPRPRWTDAGRSGHELR